ncbi:hypothetical protein EUX98_g93 [Antrodiella citrinella]|uniref:Elongation of fatty acids protein n=1 Tax=Antrodiella citrinella TaxID=2447956 RepID=A0A4S4N4Z8_9APHY|nr:hypothetical protein EUX98_g93 [Antrodiella citrinella]
MALADFILAYVPLPKVPHYLSSYVTGSTPLSTTQEVYPALATYLVVIFSIQWFMKDRTALKLQYPFQAHNVFLSAGSFLLLILILEAVIPEIFKHGLFHGMCNVKMWTSRLEFYYMINYYFKYLELLDTVFLALKKKPLAFLHVFHHSATALLCYSQLEGRTSVSWVPISLNLAVHVVMYYYYYATAGGARIWWKKYLTTMQITQFVIDLCAVYFGTYSYYAATYYHFLPNIGTCAGTEYAALFGCGLLSSYLVLFINFYIQTYKSPAKGKKSQANGKPVMNGNGVANGLSSGIPARRLNIAMGSIQNETYVSLELYVPKSASIPRKQLTRRKTERRESTSVRTLTTTIEGSSKKVKEKSSWLGLPSRTGGGNEPWRPATCKLLEESGGCVFSVFVDWTNIMEPYLQYGAAVSSLLLNIPHEQLAGALTLLCRTRNLTCMQGRNLGTPRPLPEDIANADSEPDAIDLDAYCEIYVNSILCGRTTVKKCIGNPEWNESFNFTDLSPFEQLEIVVYRERKLVKPMVVGSILVYLMNFRRGEVVEGWFPVVNNSGTHVGVQLGELRLKMRVDEEIILPSNAYAGMHKVLQSRNYLDWITDFETKLKLKDALEHVMAIAQSHDVLVDNIKELANREVDGTHMTHNTLFELRSVFAHIRQLVQARYVAKTGEDSQEFKDLPWQSVSSFLFLRFMVPAILHPHLWGFWPGMNEEPIHRSLTLIAKVIHSLANLNTSVQKEDFMHTVKDFLSKNSGSMLDYANVVTSSQPSQAAVPLTKEERAAERHRMRLENLISQRTETLRRLHREALRLPPHLLDVPMHYASIASLVVRYSRRCSYHSFPIDQADAYFHSFYSKSMDVEELALTRVNELARRPRREQQTIVSSVSPSTANPPVPISPVYITSPRRERKTSLQPKRRRSRRTGRPSTAPGESDGRSSPPDASVPSSPTTHTLARMFSRSSLSCKQPTPIPPSLEDVPREGESTLPPPTRANLGHHPRSTSTDSALFRSKSSYVNASSTSSVSHVVIEAIPPDGPDEKKRKGILRGILRRGPS